jgi:hypothetical protein
LTPRIATRRIKPWYIFFFHFYGLLCSGRKHQECVYSSVYTCPIASVEKFYWKTSKGREVLQKSERNK